MRKALIIAHNSRFIAQFERNNIRLLQSLGYEVHCATNFEHEEMVTDAKELIEQCGAIIHQVDIERMRFTPNVFLKNFRAYRQLKEILRIGFDVIHCHTPIGGVITRIAAIGARKQGTKVIYTAHGFHFFKGAPLINWLFYFPIEWMLSYVTDVLITINKEDYKRAQKLGAKKVCYVSGVGIDIEKLKQRENRREELRAELGLHEEDFVLLSVGEVNRNKNHRIVIEAVAQLKEQNICYIICGEGPLIEENRMLAEKLNIAERVIFTGFRSDVRDFYKAADLFVFPSFREGLSVALMEAMACGLPVICSNIRGNIDLIENGMSGSVVNHDSNAFSRAIQKAMDKPEMYEMYANAAYERVAECDLKYVKEMYREIYEGIS